MLGLSEKKARPGVHPGAQVKSRAPGAAAAQHTTTRPRLVLDTPLDALVGGLGGVSSSKLVTDLGFYLQRQGRQAAGDVGGRKRIFKTLSQLPGHFCQPKPIVKETVPDWDV